MCGRKGRDGARPLRKTGRTAGAERGSARFYSNGIGLPSFVRPGRRREELDPGRVVERACESLTRCSISAAPGPGWARRRRSTPSASKKLKEAGFPFLVAGTYAVAALDRDRPADQGPRRLLQDRRLPAHPPSLPAARLRHRGRGRALDREGPARRLLLRRDLQLDLRRRAGERRLVRGATTAPGSTAPRRRSCRRPSWSWSKMLRPEPRALRRRRRGPPHPEAARADRLEAAALATWSPTGRCC